MIPSNLLVLAACVPLLRGPVQDSWAPPPVDAPIGTEAAPIEHMDEVVAIVHDRIFTRSDWATLVAQAQREDPERARDPKALDELASDILEERLDELLQIQACRDAGFDPVRIEELVERFFDDYVRTHGGPAPTAAFLAARNATPADVKENMRDRMLAQTWREMETGKNPGITGRVERDRYVRPGQIWAVYQIERQQEDPHWMELIGGDPEKVVLQSLALPVDARGTKAALEQAAEIRQEAVEGADFGQLVRAWSASPRENGISKPLAVQALAALSGPRHGDDRFAEFVRGAEIGAISEPMLGERTGSASGTDQEASERPMVFLYRMLERIPAHLPAFDQVETQRRIRKEIERLTDERRVKAAMRALTEALMQRSEAEQQPDEPPPVDE